MSAGTSPDFPVIITAIESEAGFVLLRARNPHAHIAGSTPELYVMVRPVDASNRLLKARSPGGQIHYVHRQRDQSAPLGPDGERPWRSLSGPIADLDTAIAVATRIAAALQDDSKS